MASQSFQLVMRVGPSPGKIFELTQNEIVMGRDIDNEIVINDAEISRRHTRLLIQEGGYVVEDLGSTNGTFVNGKKIAGSHVLQPGQTVRMGENVTLSYEVAGFDPNATIASGGQQAAPPPRTARPAPAAQPAARASSPAAQSPQSKPPGNLGALTSNRNLMLGCGAALIIGVCIVSIFLYTAPETFWCNYLGFLFSNCN
ncbi:MAG: FHA domain-containing protein [Chloroflexota bacterium]